MRIRSQLQLYFKPQSLSTTVSLELEEASKLLESLPEYREILLTLTESMYEGRRKDRA